MFKFQNYLNFLVKSLISFTKNIRLVITAKVLSFSLLDHINISFQISM